VKNYRFDVVIVGAGPAGVTAAGALAGSGISVALIETAVYAGAENWSGCVYFAESLASEECFGHAAVAAAPFERRVVRRGTLVHNGIDVAGVALSDPAAFENCYTVLRPVYDPYFVDLARSKGAALITGTTVLSLIRKDGQVIGVQTDRGPLYAGVVFIAEGDASHLVRSERLERVPDPHYLQGVKAVLSLPVGEIDSRFSLGRREGAAYEILVRNPAVAGRTAGLNIGAFLYTNRDSLSLGCVVPLENLKKHFRGDHDRIFEWLRTLPSIADQTRDAKLSAYGTRIIRSGGWRERPRLVEDGLAVGGASVGLGIDLPFPNFTGPASATGLYFARAVKALLREGRPFSAKHLDKSYVAPLKDSVYGRNARHLSRWPAYFSRSRVLFGRTPDILCGAARFLASGSTVETARFLRGHLLSPRALKELVVDTLSSITSLGLGKHVLAQLVHPATIGNWLKNSLIRKPEQDARLDLIVNVGGRRIDPASLPWPVGRLAARLSPAIAQAISAFYANNAVPVEVKLAEAIRILVRSLSVIDLVVLPCYGLFLAALAAGTAVGDAFRYYILKTPAEKMLAEPVMAYQEALRKARDLEAVKPSAGIEAKLALNTYQPGSISHIRTLWPLPVPSHPDMAGSSLWWVCPARVYAYDAPLAGRGKITVNWENCIKCESCWRAEPRGVLWGRFTDHRLIYRPESGAITGLLGSLKQNAAKAPAIERPQVIDHKLWYLNKEITSAVASVLNAIAAFRAGVAGLPASTSAGRMSWTRQIGDRLIEKMTLLEAALLADERPDPAREIRREKADIGQRLVDGGLFHALYAVARLEQELRSWTMVTPDRQEEGGGHIVSAEEVSAIFPDRVVKQWEDGPLPNEWATKLRQFIAGHLHPARPAIRALASVSPALGLIAAHQMAATRIFHRAGRDPLPGAVLVSGGHTGIVESNEDVTITGWIEFVPTAASTALLLVSRGRAHILPFTAPGITITPTPAIGFRAAGLSRIELNCALNKQDAFPVPENIGFDPASYLAIALGAGDYLSRRAREHAAGRVQFPGQMLDTQGRDGVAKLGAVKALLARTEAWRMLLETLYRAARRSHGATSPEFGALCSATAALAFGPEPGCMAYDAGQVFGGFAYSEDDLLSRFYRDSSLYRFLAPGYGASAVLHAGLSGADLGTALAHELGTISGIDVPPLAPLARRWHDVRKTCEALPTGADRAQVGEAQALLLGIRALLAAVERELDAGGSREHEAASIEALLGIAEKAVMKAALTHSAGRVAPGAVFPIAPDVAAVDLSMDYESFCNAPGKPHRSGTFLLSVFDRTPRYVPEMQLHDPKLRQQWRDLVDWFKANAGGKSFEGMHFERYVEKIHNLPEEVIAAVKQNKWLATYVPREADGLGWRKAGYYVLNSASGSFGDAAVCLLIMASTSIGTTPVLLGLEDELPRVREELAPLVRDPKQLGDIGSRIKRLVSSFTNPNPRWVRKEYSAIMKLVDDRIRRTRVVKYLSANFLRAFYGAGIAGRRGDFGGFMTNLARAAELFERIMPDVRDGLDELPRRERSHRLFLRNLGNGGVSAFALTEPTAGSDSGGVKTLAVLRTAMLAALPDGRYVFSPTGELDKCKRYLIDADRIAFTEGGMVYRTPDDRLAPVRYDRYDYVADEGVRSYEYQGMVCEFHDIGQVRTAGTGPRYEYYSLTGSKMWITNGSLATQFCLFAQTPEGVTGFMVDRHAEGLKVGADERKMGQRGSPTNEISLDNVRVPREAVIGYEGHGQVNALETLNVGRCGLAVVAGALARKLMAEASQALPQSEQRDRLLGEAAAIQFGSESLAYYLIGLFDRPHESVRMESAIAKYVCSEDVHEIISLLERAYGPAGQTEQYLLEKARRDARILNIYEGTNEVQRFLILKDLIAQAADWPGLPERLPERPRDDAAMTLAKWKNLLRKHVLAARERLGDAAWSDAMLQPALFPLAEMAGEILRLECVLYRCEWLAERSDLLGPAYVEPLLQAGRRAAERALATLEHLDNAFALAWQQLSRDLDPPEVRAADAALDNAAKKNVPDHERVGALTAPLRILSIIRPIAVLSPLPRLDNGALSELVWEVDPLDRSGLDQALALKAAGNGNVTVHVLMPAGPEREQLFRSAAPAADRLFRLDQDRGNDAALARAVKDLEVDGNYDVIILGADSIGGDHGLAPFLAGCLKRPYVPVPRMQARSDSSGIDGISAPSIIGISAGSSPKEHGISDLVEGLSREITVIGSSDRPSSLFRFSRPAGKAIETRTITTVADAAVFLKEYAAAASAARTEPYNGTIGKGTLANGPAVWSILDPVDGKGNLAALRVGRIAADLFGKTSCAVVAAPRGSWPSLVGLARANGMDKAFCIDTKDGALSGHGRQQVLKLIMTPAGAPLIIAGAGWNDAVAATAGGLKEGNRTRVVTNIGHLERDADGTLSIEVPVYSGRLVRQERVGDGSALLTMSSDAELPAQDLRDTFTAVEIDTEAGPDWAAPLPPPAQQTLSNAEVIIDLGYGVRDNSGKALAMDLKKVLEGMGLSPMFGTTRKVTQDLKLLPLEAQIGQTGVRVNPKLIIALGISGAPQHIDWIGTRAEILCFNKDPEAPLMRLNQTRPAPRVHPIAGDLFVTVRELIEKLH
jgi:alkylation response protein AidB-like acyl-CoA dehydrogenase/flavin-dependent dehydrogenase/electron transfer flavoprotein alpha subunit